MAHRGLWDLKQSLAPAEAARTLWLASLFAVGGKNLPPAVSAAFVGLFTTGTWPTG